MDWLKSLAPLLGTALGGPLGGAAASFIADKLGIKESTVEAVTDVLSSGKMTSEQIASLKAAEIEFKRFCEANKIRVEEIAAADRDSARKMQMVSNSRMPATLTLLITSGFFGVLGGMFYFPEIKESAPLMIMLGSLGTAWTSACAFWFGTTMGSQQKSNLLAQSKPV